MRQGYCERTFKYRSARLSAVVQCSAVRCGVRYESCGLYVRDPSYEEFRSLCRKPDVTTRMFKLEEPGWSWWCWIWFGSVLVCRWGRDGWERKGREGKGLKGEQAEVAEREAWKGEIRRQAGLVGRLAEQIGYAGCGFCQDKGFIVRE